MPDQNLNQIPDEVTLQLRVPTGLAYAFRELTRAYERLGENCEEARQQFIQHLAIMAANTTTEESHPEWQACRRST